MKRSSDDTFHAVCIICTAAEAPVARQGACEFHRQDSPRFTDTPDMMLRVGISPSGDGPATHFICTRHDTLEALGRIETYQEALVAAGKPRVPVTLYISESVLVLGKDQRQQIADYEALTLKSLGLRRIG